MFGATPLAVITSKDPDFKKKLNKLEKERRKKDEYLKGIRDMMIKSSKVKKNMGGVMKNRGGTFKGTY
jgi:hypothetical protein